MDLNQNEVISDEMGKSDNNFKYTKLTNYKTKDQNFKSSKTFNRLPPLSSTNSTNDIRHGYNYTLRATKLEFSQILNNQQVECDPNTLKKDLSLIRTNLQKKKNELLLLKIKYTKLYDDNMNNKTVIAKVLSIPLHNYITKDVLIYKIENCELTPKNREILEKSYEIINLKLEIEEKKRKIAENMNMIEELEKNSKRKIINELQNDYYTKCEQQRSLLNTLQKLEEKYDYYEKKIKEINENINNERKNGDKISNKDMELSSTLQNNIIEKENLVKQINQLEEKIQKQEKLNKDKENNIKNIERNMKNKKERVNIIKNYANIRENEIKTLETKKNSKEEIEKLIKEQEKSIKELSDEFDKLNQKITNYRLEKPKLIFKAKEPKKDLEKMESLKTELNNLYKEKENTEKNHKEKQKELKEISEEANKKSEKNNENIQKNNMIKEELNKKLDELKLQINNIDIKNIY